MVVLKRPVQAQDAWWEMCQPRGKVKTEGMEVKGHGGVHEDGGLQLLQLKRLQAGFGAVNTSSSLTGETEGEAAARRGCDGF